MKSTKKSTDKERRIDIRFFNGADLKRFKEIALKQGLKPSSLARKICYSLLNDKND